MKLRRYAAALRAYLNGPGLVPSCGNSCPDFKVSRITGVTVRDSMRVRFHFLIGRLMQIRPRTWGALFSGLMLWNGCNFVAPAQASEGRHALAMHGEPALPEDFSHLPYADPAAPKGGRLIQGVLGTFDSLNPFIVRGIAPQSIRGYVVESLMTRGYDEPFTLYGLLARKVETDPQRSFVTFHLDPAAKFSDGKPVTAEDVLFSWQLLRDKGRPNHRIYYAKVAKAEAIGDRAVRFDLADSDDRELPLILGLMPVLARHAGNGMSPSCWQATSGGRWGRRPAPKSFRQARFRQSQTMAVIVLRMLSSRKMKPRRSGTSSSHFGEILQTAGDRGRSGSRLGSPYPVRRGLRA
jgi:hypothetical protein